MKGSDIIDTIKAAVPGLWPRLTPEQVQNAQIAANAMANASVAVLTAPNDEARAAAEKELAIGWNILTNIGATEEEEMKVAFRNALNALAQKGLDLLFKAITKIAL